MRPTSTSTLSRGLQLALLMLLAAHAPQAAAVAGIAYVPQGGPEVTERHQTSTRIVIDFFDNSNALIATRLCVAPGTCNYLAPAGAARFAMVLEYDASREELVSETCNGVASNVLQGRCVDGDLRVNMRVRWGTVNYRFVADDRAGKPYAPRFGSFGDVARLEFGGAAANPKYWEPRQFHAAGGGYATAAGDYDVATPEMSGPCRPQRTNPNDRLTVREGQTTEFTVRYTGTHCTMSVRSFSTPADAGSIVSEPAGLNCSAAANPSSCRADFAFDSTVRLVARPAAGWQASFGRNFTGCSRDVADQAVCEIAADGDYELSANFSAASAPPPPPPVSLSVGLGSANPADASVAKGSAEVALLQFVLTPANGAVRLRALTLQAGGSGRDDLDLNDVRIHHDANGNGRVDSGEPVLARGQVAADNGSLRLALDTPLQITQPTALLVAADIAGTVHKAAATGGVLVALALLALVRPTGRRPARQAGPALLVCLVLLLAACGGSDTTVIDPLAAANPNAPAPAPAPPAPAPPAPAPPPPVLLTYRLQLTAVEATDTTSAAATLTVTALPLTGALITVQQ